MSVKKIKDIQWSLVVATVVSVFLYTYVLACLGVAGSDVQKTALHCGAFVLKYGAVLFGFVLFAVLPYRIGIALKKREKILYDMKSEQTIAEAERKSKGIKEKIMQEYIKNEDMI